MRQRLLSLLATSLIVLAQLAPASASAPAICALSGRPAAPSAAGAQAGEPQAPTATVLAQPGQAYIHTSDLTSLILDPPICDSTYLDNPALNGQPNTGLFITSNALPYHYGAQPNGTRQGVWYDLFVGRWAIYNENQNSMSLALDWNIFIPPQDSTLIVHASSAGNIAGPLTRINDPLFNNQPNALIFVQHVFNPGTPAIAGAIAGGLAASAPTGGGGNFYTRTVAVAYDSGAQKWAIRNADGSAFPAGATFFALAASSDETAFTHTVTVANLTGPAATQLDSPLLNDNPDAQILVTQNYGAGVANNHEVAAAYSGTLGRWLIYNQDTANMPLGARFNVLVIPPKQGAFVQIAGFASTFGNAITLDHPDLNGNPDALVYVEHNYSPPELNHAAYNDHPLGVRYAAGRWHIENVDGADMVFGTSFNVYYTWPRSNAFSLTASDTNMTGTTLSLNSPLFNGHPGVPAIATFNHTPAGLPGAVYTPTIGLGFNNALSETQVVNPGGPSFVISQTYNILAPSANTFVVTATFALAAPDINPTTLTLNNALTNDKPWALLFVTPVDNSGINHHNLGVYYLYGVHKWAIFTEDFQPIDSNSVYNIFVVQRNPLWLPLVMR